MDPGIECSWQSNYQNKMQTIYNKLILEEENIARIANAVQVTIWL